MQIKAAHWAVFGAQIVVFAALLDAVTTWRQFATIVLSQIGVTIVALTRDAMQGRNDWSPERRAAEQAKLAAADKGVTDG